MANADKPNGFRPIRYLNGAPYTGGFTKYVVVAADATALFAGDLVKLSTTGDGVTTGLRTVVQAAASDAVVGVVVGFEVIATDLNTPQYRAASTRRIVYVADDPNLLFEGQEDGDTTPIAMASIGLNVDVIVAAGSTTTGASGMEIDSSTVATTATLPLKLMEVTQREDNEKITAGQTGTRWVVKLNNHQLGSHTGTAGV